MQIDEIMTINNVIIKTDIEFKCNFRKLMQTSSLSVAEREKLSNENILLLGQFEQTKTKRVLASFQTELNNMLTDNLPMVNQIARLVH